ncbi:sugar ABC transporter ATP-binding protein [Oscillochloris sp. ZM17-4]|uniref:sugar ABC transporter ATP-binding protein n=1 Tax=Oscillochloris sp. ZM17-4 TaxID=2866714 RepID=UPI001C739019|nr:sugar ABC transporter ATP-binding protein [Oscillochloris sp. ZM17-4]MBX0331238.1 sugar ABC transporter ATP-binding protein [Oscillochloris sp. ZM17-4]
MTDDRELVAMRGITKAFPGVVALEDITFSLRKGEIHALMGENGAGKSTLIKVLTGVEHPDRGTIALEGKQVQVRSPQQSQALGISTVYQEVNLCTNLSVAENIMLGREPRRLGSIHWKKLNALAEQALGRLGIDLDVTQPLENYSVAIQQMVAIARALAILAVRVLILDEPTSSLDMQETARLFDVMRKLKGEGIGIIFITHFLDQVYQVADRITVLRNGKYIGTYDTASLSRVELVATMLGRNLSDLHAVAQAKVEIAPKAAHACVAEAKGLGLKGSLAAIDLSLNAGEVVGVAGLLGSGRTELARLIFGVDAPDSGSLSIDGQKVERFSPHESLKRGIALCPEDRKAEGIVGELSIRENIILALQARYGWFKVLNTQKQYEIAAQYIKLLGIRTPSPDQLVKNLSGGNQQKVILARWIVTQPHVLILDEPTRGIDVGAKVEIQKLVLDLVKEGMAIIFISSELEEVLRISQRILVMRDRKKVAEYAGDVNDQTIMHTMAGDL